MGVREDTACTSARARARTQGSQQPPLSAPAWASDQVATAPHLPLKVASSASHVASLSLDFLMCQKKGGGRNLTYMVFPAVLLWGSYQLDSPMMKDVAQVLLALTHAQESPLSFRIPIEKERDLLLRLGCPSPPPPCPPRLCLCLPASWVGGVHHLPNQPFTLSTMGCSLGG